MNEEERNDELETTEEMPAEETFDEIPSEDDEMSQDEIEQEVAEDEEDTIEDDIEQPFYATDPKFDELRDVLVDLDYRLLLINGQLVTIARLNGVDLEIMINTGTEEEPNYSFVTAPETLEEFKKVANVLYFSPDMTEEDLAEFEGKEANQESVMDFLMNELPDNVREEKEEEETEEEFEDEVSDETVEEPIEDETPIEDEEEDEENE